MYLTFWNTKCKEVLHRIFLQRHHILPSSNDALPCSYGVSQIKETRCNQWIITEADDKGHAMWELVDLLEIAECTSCLMAVWSEPSDTAGLTEQARGKQIRILTEFLFPLEAALCRKNKALANPVWCSSPFPVSGKFQWELRKGPVQQFSFFVSLLFRCGSRKEKKSSGPELIVFSLIHSLDEIMSTF